MALLLGCIADHFAGAAALASALVNGGMRVVLYVGLPSEELVPHDADAAVIALQSRYLDADVAVEQALAALGWLRRIGAQRFFFKCGSTFDSSSRGNVGHVAAGLLDSLGAAMTVVCPAQPDSGRTIYQGHLFAGDKLVSEAGPGSPGRVSMTDPNLVRCLQRQTRLLVGLLPFAYIRQGPEAIRRQLGSMADLGCRLIVLDAMINEDLRAVGLACFDSPLMTGSSGLALGLPNAYRSSGLLSGERPAGVRPNVQGPEAVLVGSLSAASLRQIQRMQRHRPSFAIKREDLAAGKDVAAEVLDWAGSRIARGPVLIHTVSPDEALTPDREPPDQAELREQTLAQVAVGLIGLGWRRLIVSGNDTSQAVLAALGVRALRVGAMIEHGVPWLESLGEPALALVVKSGKTGGEDFFAKALDMLR